MLNRQLIVILFLLVGIVYATTANYSLDINVDSQAAALSAWSLVTRGTLNLSEFAVHPWIHQFQDGHYYSDRPMGVIMVAVPAYTLTFLAYDLHQLTFAPATVTAVLLTTLAVVLLFLILLNLLPPRHAFIGALIFAFGTQTWGISANQLWQHGPAQFGVALGLYLSTKSSFFGAGVGFGLALLMRPITMIIPAIFGLYLSWSRTMGTPALRLGIPAFLCLGLLVSFNYWLTGVPSILPKVTGHYIQSFTNIEASSYFLRVFELFFGAENGLFLWSPFLLVLCFGIPAAWRSAPDWTKAGFISGVIFLLIHLRFNRVSGGVPFGYRYPLEMLVMIAPLGALAYREWVSKRSVRRGAFLFAVLISILIHALLSITQHCVDDGTGQLVCRMF